MDKQKTHTLQIHGMHCDSCALLIENELGEHPLVSSANARLETRSVEICGDFGDMTPMDIAAELTKILSQHALSTEKQEKEVNWNEFVTAIPIVLVFVVLFILLQKIGLVNIINTSSVSYGTAFLIGVVASLSTCMAVVGGLVLSMSATFAQKGDRVRPQVLFHTGRIISFFVLGGAIGAIGASFTLGTTGIFILSLLIGIVMLLLGVNLLDVFPSLKRFQPSMPKFLSKHALGVSKLNHMLTPLLVGVATFFLPCGFTQAMQLYSLTTGSFFAGGLTMLAFALGTLPVLALIGFSSFSMKNSSKSGVFFKSAGLIVILFAIFNITNSLAVVGILSPTENTIPTSENTVQTNNVSTVNGQQIIEIQAKGGYMPRTSTAKAGITTILRFNTNGTFDCSSFVRIPSMNISSRLPSTGVTDITVDNPKVGLLQGMCGMGMYPFEINFQN